MSLRSMCCSVLLGSLLAMPALGQSSSTSAEQPANSTPQGTQAAVSASAFQQENTAKVSSTGIEIVRTMEDIRERILLDKIDQLEKRLSELEARGASSAAPAAAGGQAPASTAPGSRFVADLVRWPG